MLQKKQRNEREIPDEAFEDVSYNESALNYNDHQCHESPSHLRDLILVVSTAKRENERDES
jgi:hypothetical protein